MTDFAVRVQDLTVAYDAQPVLWDIDLEIPRSSLVAIVGPNGAGKSTLLKAMLGLLKPVTGGVTFPSGLSKHDIGYVPQSENVDWDFPTTALDVVLMGRYGHLGLVRRPKKADRALALSCLEKVGMADHRDRQIAELSGGQQQRVFLARALCQEANIYFMDEPFKGVDTVTEKTIVALLQELKAAGKTVIVVHHDLQTVPDYFDWVALINMQLIDAGPVSEVFHAENLSRTYRGAMPPLKGAV